MLSNDIDTTYAELNLAMNALCDTIDSLSESVAAMWKSPLAYVTAQAALKAEIEYAEIAVRKLTDAMRTSTERFIRN